jgi:D-3-phosphoglycerate dehydrogenase / 2-oxoglutarate reductase
MKKPQNERATVNQLVSLTTFSKEVSVTSPYRVVVTGFGGYTPQVDYEREALDPLGAQIDVLSPQSEDEYVAQIRTADAIVAGGFNLDARVIRSLEKCKIIANGGIGVDRVDLDAATERGIVVTNVPDVFVDEVANHALMLILCLAKKTVQIDRCVRENRWREARQFFSPMPKLTNQTIGLVAFGNIPRAVTRRAKAFDMTVIAWDPFVSADVFAQHGVERVESLEDLFRRSDFVSAHLPLNADTYHLITEKHFRAMKPTGYFVNTGRGPVVDEAALIKALQEKWIAGAGLDVMEKEPTTADNPLHAMDNVVLTPHSASISDVANVERRRRVGQEIAAVLQGRVPRSVVNKAVLDKVSLQPA